MLNWSQDNQDVTSAIRVAIIEDRQEIREGLQQILDGADGYSTVAGYGSMETALPGLREIMKDPELAPSAVLIDIGLPGMSGIDGIRRLKSEFPRLSCLVLSVFQDDNRIFEAICAGASGYLLKTTPPDRLLASLREVVEGGSPMTPEVARRVVDLFRRFGSHKKTEKEDSNLTPHQKRILALLANGYTFKAVAAELSVTVDTISYHARGIYDKLQVHSKSAAIAKAIKNNVI
ncbi:MAG: response regulator [Blastocatellia bacterium]